MYKPGNLSASPPVLTPHQPRLDWQMWFAALGSQTHSPWFSSLLYRLLQGKTNGLYQHMNSWKNRRGSLLCYLALTMKSVFQQSCLNHCHFNLSSGCEALQAFCDRMFCSDRVDPVRYKSVPIPPAAPCLPPSPSLQILVYRTKG